MKIIKLSLIFIAAALTFSACNKTREADMEQTSAAAEISGTVSEEDVSDIILSKIVKEVTYSEDGKTLIAVPSDWTGINGKYIEVVPDRVETIGDYAFYNSKLKDVRMSDGLETIGNYAFCNSNIEVVKLPDTLKTIGDYAFYGSSITKIIIPAGVTEIGNCAFENSALESIEFSEGLETIGDSAFANTKIKEEIILPRSIKNCGMIFGQTENYPTTYVPADVENNDGMLPLKNYKNIIYRNESDLEFLIRKTDGREKNYPGRIFIDLDGDNFPEMAETDSSRKSPDIWLRKFDLPSGTWKKFLKISADTDLNLFHDKENDRYFYIYSDYDCGFRYINKFNITENGFSCTTTLGKYRSSGSYNNQKQGYRSNKKIDYGYIKGKFFIEENIPDIAVYKVNEIMPHCELISTINIQEIIDKYSNDSAMYEIVMSPFADSPQPSEYKKPLPKSTKHETEHEDEYNLVIYGYQNRTISSTSYSASLKGDEISEINFEKLSHMPNLIYLYIRSFFADDWDDDIGVGYNPSYEEMYEERTIDLSGISKLSGLEYLEIETDNIINTSEIGKLKNLKMLRITGNADDLSFLADMDSLVVFEIYSASDEPVDFFEPIYNMKNLKYLIVDHRDGITAEQAAHIAENAPHINIL